jgi:hypothetical protein
VFASSTELPSMKLLGCAGLMVYPQRRVSVGGAHS